MCGRECRRGRAREEGRREVCKGFSFLTTRKPQSLPFLALAKVSEADATMLCGWLLSSLLRANRISGVTKHHAGEAVPDAVHHHEVFSVPDSAKPVAPKAGN